MPTCMQTWYAVCHLPTGRLLPVFRNGNRRGGTHVELDDNQPPRLFSSAKAAKDALRWWLGGKYNVSYSYSSDWENEAYPIEKIIPIPERTAIADEMQIVQVNISVRLPK